MDLLRIFKKKKKSRALPPIRTVRDPAVARQERQARQQADHVASTPPVEEKELDLFDTSSLEMAREPGDGDNPYDTQTWQVGGSKGLRRVDDLKAVNKKRKSGEKDNPYDTIVTRKGW